MGLEIAEQTGYRLADVILYPTGGGTGLIGMWKAVRTRRTRLGDGDGCRVWSRCRRPAARRSCAPSKPAALFECTQRHSRLQKGILERERTADEERNQVVCATRLVQASSVRRSSSPLR